MNKRKEIWGMVKIARRYAEKFINTPSYYRGVYTDMEAVYEAGYRKADDLIAEIAGLKGKCEALQKDNDNLMRTFEAVPNYCPNCGTRLKGDKREFVKYSRLTPKDLVELINVPQDSDLTRFLFHAHRLWQIENAIERGDVVIREGWDE